MSLPLRVVAEEPEYPSPLATLNEEQLAAATTRATSALVLAGPGSGKTKTLIARIVDLLNAGASPASMLVVTFSRRATAELRHRLETLLPEEQAHAVRVSTLHAFALRLVRDHCEALGLSDRLTVADPEDIERHIKRWLIKQPAAIQAEGVQAHLKQLAAIRAERFEHAIIAPPGEAWETMIAAHTEDGLFATYAELLHDQHVIDLDLVVPAAALLLRDRPALCADLSAELSHIMVDEFQDTSTDQWELLSALAPCGGNVCLFAVGDDAQSIYGWRGATLRNMERLISEYPECHQFTLQRNYRSAPRIVRAANAVLPHTGSRWPRTLWTDSDCPTAIQVVSSSTPHEEARYVVQRILDLQARGEITRLRDALVLYRTNALGHALEEAFREARVPYRLSAGRQYFERPEIRGIIGLLTCAVNPDDHAAAERAMCALWPKPSGAAIKNILAAAEQQHCSVWRLLKNGGKIEGVTPAQAERLATALPLLRAIRDAETPAEAVRRAIHETGLKQRLFEAVPSADPTFHNMPEREFWTLYYQAERRVEAVDSLQELANRFTRLAQYDHWLDGPVRDLPASAWAPPIPLHHFLDDIATLLDDTDLLASDAVDAVPCMTVHAAKGLESPAVFVVGMNEGEFPVLSPVHLPGRKTPEWVAHEEDARVFFVAITRAERFLHLTHTRAPSGKGRRSGGAGSSSRYLAMLPDMTFVRRDRE